MQLVLKFRGPDFVDLPQIMKTPIPVCEATIISHIKYFPYFHTDLGMYTVV